MRHTRQHALKVFAVALMGPLPFSAYPAGQDPVNVVKAFNAAITDRKNDAITAQLAKGGVQFTLRTAHAGMTGAPTGITSDLVAHWGMVTPLLFTVTSSYKRTPEIVDSRVDGEVATVWTRISTETVERDGKSRKESFTELYLLVHSSDGWKIGAIVDNRGTDKRDISQPQQFGRVRESAKEVRSGINHDALGWWAV